MLRSTDAPKDKRDVELRQKQRMQLDDILLIASHVSAMLLRNDSLSSSRTSSLNAYDQQIILVVLGVSMVVFK